MRVRHARAEARQGGRPCGARDFSGAYFYADFVSGRVWALRHEGGEATGNTHVTSVPSPSSFGEDRAGELYITSFDGRIYRLAVP